MGFRNDYEFSFIIYLLNIVYLFDTSECVVNGLETDVVLLIDQR
jgi:hypothetical protein